MDRDGTGQPDPPTTTGVPATVDLGRHFRQLRRVALPALLVALLCAGAVFAVRLTAPKQWDATVVARAEASSTPAQSSGDPATTGSLLTAPYIALGADTNTLHDIVDAARVPWSQAKTHSRISVTSGDLPGLVDVKVTGDSSQQASAVARQTVLTLDSAARKQARSSANAAVDQLQAEAAALSDRVQSLGEADPNRAALQAQYQSTLDQLNQLRGAAIGTGTTALNALSDPSTSGTPSSPQPWRDAGVALLVAWILFAEVLVGLRGRWGRRVSRAWADRIARKHGITLADWSAKDSDTDRARIESLVLQRLRAGDAVVVLRDPEVGPASMRSLREAVSGAADAAPDRLVDLATEQHWWRHPALAEAGLSLVLAGRGTKTRRTVLRRLAALRELHVPTLLVLASRGEAAPPAEKTSGGAVSDGRLPDAEVVPATVRAGSTSAARKR